MHLDNQCHVSFVDLTYELTLKSFELTGKNSPDVFASCFLCNLFPLVPSAVAVVAVSKDKGIRAQSPPQAGVMSGFPLPVNIPA